MSAAQFARLAVILIVIMATAVIAAPAVWVGDLVQSRGPLRLVHAEGSLWHGSGFVAVSDGRRAHVVPGIVTWRVELLPLLAGRIVVSLRHDTMDRALRIVIDNRTVSIEPGEAQVPAALLAALGAPFNTVRPGGTLYIRWDRLRIVDHGFEGNVKLDWQNAQSALSRVAPLGDYRLTATGRGARGEANLVTLKGPLLLQGQGTMESGRIRFSGTAEAQPDMRGSLSGLIGLLGRRMGDRALLEWDTQT